MRIAEINMCVEGSTGKIMLQIAECARDNGHEVVTFSTHQFNIKYKKKLIPPNGHEYYGTYFENAIHYILARETGLLGCFAAFETRRLITKIKKMKPDIIHFHNLHGFCINFPELFNYVKKSNFKVIWTLHDCWTFTGHCPHFDMIGCNRWKNQCYECPQHLEYPKSIIDNSKYMYNLKKKWFTGIKNMILVTPSEWLANLTRQSYMGEYEIKVINNGIDLSIFKPTKSDFRKKYMCEDKFLILGVAFGWGIKKGLDVFIELAHRLDNNYQIILVGTDDIVDLQLPNNIISIHRTENQRELAEIYTAVDLFVNPTREDTYPTVNMEAIACGTPVLSFNTGGGPEIIDSTCGKVVEKDNIDQMEQEIIRILHNGKFSVEKCVQKAKQFDMNRKFKEYVELYESI